MLVWDVLTVYKMFLSGNIIPEEKKTYAYAHCCVLGSITRLSRETCDHSSAHADEVLTHYQRGCFGYVTVALDEKAIMQKNIGKVVR